MIAAVLLAGALQIVLGPLGVARLMRYVPRAVSVGCVNALGILLFKAQFPHLEHVPAVVYALVAGGLVIIGFLPRVASSRDHDGDRRAAGDPVRLDGRLRDDRPIVSEIRWRRRWR